MIETNWPHDKGYVVTGAVARETVIEAKESRLEKAVEALSEKKLCG